MSSLYRREVNSVLLSPSIITYTCNYTHSEDHEGGLHDFISNIDSTGDSTLSFMFSCKPGTLRAHY